MVVIAKIQRKSEWLSNEKKQRTQKRSAGKPPPRCNAILLCDQTIVEAVSGKISLIGIFEVFGLPRFLGFTKRFKEIGAPLIRIPRQRHRHFIRSLSEFPQVLQLQVREIKKTIEPDFLKMLRAE